MINSASNHSGVGRRELLKTVLSGAVLGAATQAGINFANPRTLHAPTALSPDEALHELLAGNQRFAANQLTSITRTWNPPCKILRQGKSV